MRYRSSVAPRTSKPGWILLMLLGVGMVVVLYSLKSKTLAAMVRVDALERKLVDEKQAVHVLEAEVAHLGRPSRLRTLAAQQLGLQPTPIERTLTLEVAVQELREKSLKAKAGTQ